MAQSGSLTDFDSSVETFFVAGGTLRPTVPSYIERNADRELFDALTRSEFCYVLDTRQMGKSSMMARAASRLRREWKCHVVVIDLTSIGQNLAVDQWYDALTSDVGRQLDLEDEIEDFIDTHPELRPVDRWVKTLRKVVLEETEDHPVVIFFDEIDYVRSLPFAGEFFGEIRQFYNLRPVDPRLDRLTFCFLGVSTPNDLISDEATSPFHVGSRIEITDFSLTDASVLLSGFRVDPQTARKTLERVFYWTDGHPYLTQRLCRAVVSSGARVEPAEVDRLCDALFLAPGVRNQNDNLRFVASRFLAPGVDATAILDLYREVRRGNTVLDDGSHPFADTLRLSGLAKLVDGRFHVRNEIYRRVFDEKWIAGNMPKQE